MNIIIKVTMQNNWFTIQYYWGNKQKEAQLLTDRRVR